MTGGGFDVALRHPDRICGQVGRGQNMQERSRMPTVDSLLKLDGDSAEYTAFTVGIAVNVRAV